MHWFNTLESNIQSAIISGIVSAVICFISFLCGVYKDKRFLKYKLKREYQFKQRSGIKEQLAHSKTPLIKASEELNYRLWNLSQNIDKQWLNRCDNDIRTPNRCYYLKSFVYRLLSFLYWVEKSEDDIYNFDFFEATNEEKSYVKYIKVLKHFFCESSLLEGLGYNYTKEDSHFYKDNIKIYVDYIRDGDHIMSYGNFVKKMEYDYSTIKPIVAFATKIECNEKNCQYNIIKSFHLFLILFLNKYGLDYHRTSKKLYRTLINDKYCNIAIKSELLKYLTRNKVISEARWMIKYLGLMPIKDRMLFYLFRITK